MSDKSVKAWAVVDRRGRPIAAGGYVIAFKKKSDATDYKQERFGERVVRVTIIVEEE